MSKRQRSDDEGGSRSRRSHSHRRRMHVYIVVDDWSKGYSIYKVDVADFEADPGADLDSQASHLPDPPAFRLECSHRCVPHFAAVGSRIAAMGYNEEEAAAPLLLYDTATGGLAVGPRVPAEVNNAPTFVPAWDRLYVMDNSRWDERREHFQMLAVGRKGRWAWNALRLAPFDMWRVTCHAAHPDGRTIFFSAQGKGTYSFDTESGEWKRHGEWMLPFDGHAHYDGEVDAWVGLHRDSADDEPGSVCSCDVVVVPAGGGGGKLPPPPAWKVAKEKMACEDLERSMAVALTPLGGGGRFCLVEHRSRKGVPGDVLDSRYLFYATTFVLRFDKDGELRATRRRTRSYTARRKSQDFNWWAFGI